MAVCGLENGLDDGLIRINDEPQIKEPNSRAISRLPLRTLVPYRCLYCALAIKLLSVETNPLRIAVIQSLAWL